MRDGCHLDTVSAVRTGNGRRKDREMLTGGGEDMTW